MKVTSKANTNIALIKYWGNINEELTIPYNSSISMTLDKLFTITTVDFQEKLSSDVIKINNLPALGEEYQRVVDHLDIIKRYLNVEIEINARVDSVNNFPKRAGIASSASAFAALTLAATKSLNKNLDSQQLSFLARRGSGSASRSIFGGLVEWTKGTNIDGIDSYSKVLAPKEYWPELTMIILILSSKEKLIGSRVGMQRSVMTSPYYEAWLKSIEKELIEVRNSIATKDFNSLGRIMEINSFKMHSLMHTSSPPLIYWNPETIAVLKQIFSFREKYGINCYITMDAGPQIKILCLQNDIQLIIDKLNNSFNNLESGQRLTHVVCHLGEGAKIINTHLF